MKFKLNQKVIYTTTKRDAYYISLMSVEELTREELDIFSHSSYGYPSYFDDLIEVNKQISFKGKIINIHKMRNGDTLLIVKFNMGVEVGFIENVSTEGLRPLFLGLL